jgi:cytoskeletal protein CcmA (bactofilin family)
MKKLVTGAVLAATLAVPLVSLAAELRFGETASLGAGDSVKGDAYLAGSTVTSSGQVPGDLAAAGGTVLVTGAVGADALVAGGNLSVLAPVADDLRIAGGNVTVQGRVGGDLVMAGGQVSVGGAGIAGDAAIAGGSIAVEAPVGGTLRIAGGDVIIDSAISGDVSIRARSLTLGSHAVINGALAYTADSELAMKDGAVVNGEVAYTPRPAHETNVRTVAALVSAWIFGKFLILLVCALLLGLVFARYSRELVRSAAERPLLELGRGLLVIAAMPVLSVILLMTFVGIPFGVIGLLGFVILLVFSWVVAPVLLGSFLYRWIARGGWLVDWKTILLGVFVYSLLAFVPVLGWLVQAFFGLLAAGAVTAVKWRIVREWR